MSPWPSSCSAPCSPRMVRLSIFEVTWKEMRVGKFALMVPVMTSTEGRCVASTTWMPAARAIWARRDPAPCPAGARGRHPRGARDAARHLGKALDRAFDVLAGDHHQVGHLVDDDHDVGDRIELER